MENTIIKKKQNCEIKIPKKTALIVNLWDEMGLIITAPRRKERERWREILHTILPTLFGNICSFKSIN